MKAPNFKDITAVKLFETINKKYGDNIALQIKEPSGILRRLSYRELGKRAVDVFSKLVDLGLGKDDRVAILSESRPEWAVAFFGIVSAAAIAVPLDVKLSEKEIQFILNESASKCLFVSGKYLGIIEGLRHVLPRLEHVILLDDIKHHDEILFSDIKRHKKEEKNRPTYQDDVVVLVYTSGTTGTAKGVQLTYRNIFFQVQAFDSIIHYTKNDNFLSILPLNHMLEITAGLIAPLYVGARVTYCSSLKTANIISLIKETGTTAIICVPLVLRMIHDGIMKKAARYPAFKRKLFRTLLNVSKALLGSKIRAGKLLFRSAHREFGWSLRGFISGGAPLSAEVEENLNAMGFGILQGYGLTETAPVISVNTVRDNKFGSVGKPLPGVEVKILKETATSPFGEILTRGPHVMKGYYKNPEKTEEVIKDSWLHTGDLGYLDKEGFLFISGRKKNLIVLDSGKKVFPEEVEETMAESPYIKEICVFGKRQESASREGHEKVCAIIVPDKDAFKNIDDKNAVRDRIKSEINRLGKNIASYKRISNFEIRYDDLPKTPAGKVRRQAVTRL